MTPLSVTKNFDGDAEERAKEIKKLHEQVQNKIGKQNEKYCKQANKHRKPAVFKEGDLVWIHLTKERFPSKRSSKLNPRADGPFKVLQRVGGNAYKIDLPGDYNVSTTFNVSDLSPYYEDQEDQVNLGAVLFKQTSMTPECLKILQAQPDVSPGPKAFLEDQNNSPLF